MIFLSIIVPCYRNKDILKRGIPSLERQSIKDIGITRSAAQGSRYSPRSRH